MSKMNRRTMIGVAGASMAVAACGDAGSGDSGGEYGGDPKGVGKQWGEDPHASAPRKPPKEGFDPKYLCIIYVKFDANNQSIVRHGYIESVTRAAVGNEKEHEAQQIAAAEKLFAAAIDGEWKASRVGHPRKEVNFEKFDFGQQMRLFAVVDNDSVKFDDRKRKGEYANLVRFAKYRTTHDMQNFDPKKADPNHSFFGATLVPLTIGGKTRQALRLDNWFTGPTGELINPKDPSTHQYFAMDLHVLWQTTETGTRLQSIPIVIDPDGGNMGSQP